MLSSMDTAPFTWMSLKAKDQITNAFLSAGLLQDMLNGKAAQACCSIFPNDETSTKAQPTV